MSTERGERRQRLGQAGRRDQQPRAGVVGDVFDLARMQSGIGRHRAQPGRPAAEQQLEELAAILQAKQHAVAGREAAGPQARRRPGRRARLIRHSSRNASSSLTAGRSGSRRATSNSSAARFMPPLPLSLASVVRTSRTRRKLLLQP